VANYSYVATGTNTGGHVVGKYQIVSGTGAYQGATGTGGFEGDWGDKNPLKVASGLYNVELDVKTPGMWGVTSRGGRLRVAPAFGFRKNGARPTAAPPARFAQKGNASIATR
jgi:hypothetical protein